MADHNGSSSYAAMRQATRPSGPAAGDWCGALFEDNGPKSTLYKVDDRSLLTGLLSGEGVFLGYTAAIIRERL